MYLLELVSLVTLLFLLLYKNGTPLIVSILEQHIPVYGSLSQLGPHLHNPASEYALGHTYTVLPGVLLLESTFLHIKSSLLYSGAIVLWMLLLLTLLLFPHLLIKNILITLKLYIIIDKC